MSDHDQQQHPPSTNNNNNNNNNNLDLTPAEKNALTPPSPFYKIVLTGGPCGGKTTALARLSSYLRERGFEVITCPEAFGVLVNNGFDVDYFGAVGGMKSVVQGSVMDVQISLEDAFEMVLKARGKPGVLICDRGLMDGMAYMSAEEWTRFLSRRSVRSECELREGRYNAVFHLVTAALGAERYYTLENNEVRTETPEEARVLDEKTRLAWVGHPKYFVFDNSTDFEGKLQRLVVATAKLVGLPSGLSRGTRKFLLRGREPDLNSFPEDVKYHVFEVEKIYLYDVEEDESQEKDETKTKSPSDHMEEYSFIRKRTAIVDLNNTAQTNDEASSSTSTGLSIYGITTVKRMHDGQTIEVKRIITPREYNSLSKTRDMTRHVVRQLRISFLWNMQSFNIHVYREPVSDLCILHAQTEQNNGENHQSSRGEVDLPPFLDVVRPIRNDREDEEKYGAFNISLIHNDK